MDREESSEEVLDHDEEHKDLGVGRSYECVFCKRGFNTAQALGGHMNIHRKDRARNKPNSTKPPPPPFYHQIPTSGVRRFSPPDHHLAYFPPASASASASSNSTLYESTDRSHHQPSDPAVDARDWRMRLSLEFTPSIDPRGMEQDKELDLELRLGYDS